MNKKRIFLVALIAIIVMISVGALVSCSPAEIPADELATLENDLTPRVNESDVRIMSANVLVTIKSWGGEPVLSRADRFARAVKHYMPDVIGTQEFDRPWYNELKPRIKDAGYIIIKEKYSAFTENRSPIIYNANVLDVVKHGIHLYSIGDNNGCRVVSWAVFKRKSDNKVFAVSSTHFNLIRGNDIQEELSIMDTQTDEFFGVMDKLTAEYNCPIFMTGDYNCMEERTTYLEDEYYGSLGDLGGTAAAYPIYNKITGRYLDAKYSKDLVNKYDVGGGILPNGGWSSPSWDHIFVTGNASSTSFAVLSGIYFQRYENRDSRISDHLPIFADFQLH